MTLEPRPANANVWEEREHRVGDRPADDMLTLDRLSLQYGGRKIFDEVSAHIGPRDRIGLVGSNGAGKTTLLKVIAGHAETDGGEVSRARYVTVGYLPQEGLVAEGETVYREVETAFEEVLEVQRRLEDLRRELDGLESGDENHAELLEIEGELQHRLEELDAFRMKSKIESVLLGLGFSVGDMNRPTNEFSGGWQMRLAMAKLLLREPALLLLDEPTNHLDIDSQQWLENYLRDYDGALMIVSHDRAFLDTLCTRTLALSLGRMEDYAGNFSFYENESAHRKHILRQAKANQDKKLAQTQRFIDRFRAKATKAAQVQSRIKQLEKVDLIELEEEEDRIAFRFPEPPKSGRVVMELQGVAKAYGDLTVFRDLDLRIERGDRIAVVGVNGAGKSTLARILAGTEPPTAGERTEGHNLKLSLFAQHQAQELDPKKTVLGSAEETAPDTTETRVRTLLGAFLFKGDDVFKHVSVLSGGEKSRLALVRMLLRAGNFLILDEPTNHLDMQSKRVLQDALNAFPGTFVIVSHDRAFLDPVVNKVLEVSQSGLRLLPGNVSDYLQKREEEKAAGPGPHGDPSAGRRKPDGLSPRERRRRDAARRQEAARRLKPLREKGESLEKKIADLEKRKEALEAQMADPGFYGNAAEARASVREYDALKLDLRQAYADWSAVVEKIDALDNRQNP